MNRQNEQTRRFWFYQAWVGLGSLALLSGTVNARAELLVESTSPSGMTSADSPAEDLVGSQSLMEPVSAAPAAPTKPVPVQVIQQQPVSAPVVAAPAQPYPIIITTSAPAPVAPQVTQVSEEKMNRTEMTRRERMREELRNEDLLQERLEELRLQDEKRRTGQLVGRTPALAPAPVAPVASVAPVAPVIEEQVVSVPVSDRSASQASSTLRASELQTSSDYGDQEEIFSIRIAPRGGLSNFSGASPYSIEGRYTVGVGLDMAVSEHLSFDLGYSYSDYGLALNDSTAMVLRGILNPYGFMYNGSDFKTGSLRQNVVDAGLKLHLLGTASRIRPFIGGGAGYSKSFLNYDARIMDFLKRYGYGVPPDYELSQFLAYATAGVEVRLSKSVTVGANYRHYTVLSSRQNQELFNPALYGGYPAVSSMYYPGAFGGVTGLGDLERQYVGGSLAETNFYSITGTVSFEF